MTEERALLRLSCCATNGSRNIVILSPPTTPDRILTDVYDHLVKEMPGWGPGMTARTTGYEYYSYITVISRIYYRFYFDGMLYGSAGEV